jgi:type II secretory pathway component PulF
MPTYIYTAKNIKGEKKEGELRVKDEYNLAKVLREEGYILTSMKREQKKKTGDISLSRLNPFAKVSLIEKVLFTRHLGVMIKAGISLPKALDILVLQIKNEKFSKIISEVGKDVNQGLALSESLSKYPKVFSKLFVNMIKVGETSGNLEEVLFLLAEQLKKDHQLVSKVKGAMVYPAVIICAMIGIGTIMMVFVIPKLVSVFDAFETELPFITKMLILVSSFFAENIFIVIGLVIVLAIVFKIISRQSSGSKFFHSLVLRLPAVGALVIKINVARFARTLGSLLSGGVTIVQSLDIISETLTNIRYAQSLKSASQQISKGVELNKALGEYEKLYPVLVSQMIAVGEETGTLSDILIQLAEFYESEVDATLNNLSAIIEPVLMLIIGGAVGFFAVSIIQPMYSIMGGV